MADSIWEAAALAALLSAAALAGFARFAPSLPQDRPNARSLHGRAVPRAGGYAVWAGFLPAAVLFPPSFPGELAGWLPPWALLVAVSAWDDWRSVPIVPRLTVHVGAALWAAVRLVHGDAAAPLEIPGWIAILGVAAAVAWSSNLYNFMDGSDGLAALMGVAGFLAMGIASRNTQSAAALIALAAAIAPFLVVNRPPASIFLGDAGAVPLGFLAAAFALEGIFASRWPPWFPLLVFLPFVADATLTLARRVLAGEPAWKAHRSHFYQRLNQLGAGHSGTLAVYGALIAGTSVTALVCLLVAPGAGGWALLAWLVVLVMLFAAIDYHWRKNEKSASTR